MSKSRYTDTQVLNNHLKTYSLPRYARGMIVPNFLDGVKTQDHTFVSGERLDQLSFKFYGDDQYWWVIALTNNINYPFSSGGLTPGRTIKIPLELQKVLDKLMR